MATAIDIVNAVIETSSTLKDNIPLATNATLHHAVHSLYE